MRVLYVSNFDPELNAGASGSICGITTTLAGRGHEVDVIWRDTRPRLFSNQAAHELLELPWRQYAQVKEAMKTKRYDMVSISQPFSYLVYERLRPLHPETVFLNRTHGWEDRVYALRARWEPHRDASTPVLARLRRGLTHQACLRTLRSCDGIIAPAHRCASFILKNYNFPPDKIAVIPHGLYPPFFEQTLPERSENGPSKLLYIGNYLPLKGSKVLEAVLPSIAKKFSDISMTFVVGARDVEFVRKFYTPFFGSRLEVLPWTDRENLVSVYGSHHIFLFPSLFEGFGKTFLEAMACGMCVVGFEEGGLPDLATPDKEAFSCPPGDLDEFERLLEEAIRNPEKRRLVGERAKQAVRHYTWDRSVERLENFYESLQTRKRKAP